MKRRDLLQAAGAAMVLAGCATVAQRAKPHVVVIGGGYGGAAAARHVRMWSGGEVDVTLVEPNPPSSRARCQTWCWAVRAASAT